MSCPRSTSRYANQVSFTFLVWMVVFAVLLATGGVTYSVLKNSQVSVRTEINKIHRAIAVHNMNSNQYRAKANAQTNRWVMRARLNQDGSQLQDIDRSQIETARSFRRDAAMRATASR